MRALPAHLHHILILQPGHGLGEGQMKVCYCDEGKLWEGRVWDVQAVGENTTQRRKSYTVVRSAVRMLCRGRAAGRGGCGNGRL